MHTSSKTKGMRQGKKISEQKFSATFERQQADKMEKFSEMRNRGYIQRPALDGKQDNLALESSQFQGKCR